MAFKDSIRRVADRARAAAVPFARPTTVTVVVDTYTDAVGTDDAMISSTTSAVLSPSPKVSAAGSAGTSAFGGGFASSSSGGLEATEFTIGPITPKYTGGGYDADELLPVGAVDRDVYVILAGGAFEGSGERFEVVPGSLDATRAYGWTFRVRRTQQGST